MSVCHTGLRRANVEIPRKKKYVGSSFLYCGCNLTTDATVKTLCNVQRFDIFTAPSLREGELIASFFYMIVAHADSDDGVGPLLKFTATTGMDLVTCQTLFCIEILEGH